MKIAITNAHEGLTRTIGVKVDADTGKQLRSVETVYDNFTLGKDFFNPPQSSYSRTFTKTEGITPNQPHTVRVVGVHDDGSTDANSDTWND